MLYIGIGLSSTEITDLQSFTALKEFLVKKSSVHAYQDRYILSVVAADLFHDMNQHLLSSFPMIRMFAASTKNGVNQITTPNSSAGDEIP